MRKVLFLLSIVFLALTACEQKSNIVDGVEYSGALREIMEGKLDATITLNELKSIPNLYALGVVEGLKGEIQIFNSQPYNSKRSPEMATIYRNFQDNAALLVYAQVPEWQEISIPKAILTKKQFEVYLEYTAVKAGVDTSKPFPFMVEGYIRKMNWHIVNWDENNNNHSHEAHKKSGLIGVLVDEKVNIIGFFSKNHKGLFTHHTTNMHMHFKVENQKLAGHTDDFLLGEYMTLKLPKQ